MSGCDEFATLRRANGPQVLTTFSVLQGAWRRSFEMCNASFLIVVLFWRRRQDAFARKSRERAGSDAAGPVASDAVLKMEQQVCWMFYLSFLMWLWVILVLLCRCVSMWKKYAAGGRRWEWRPMIWPESSNCARVCRTTRSDIKRSIFQR